MGGDDLGVTAIKQGDPAPINGSAPLGGAFIGTFAVPAGQTISITNQPADVVTNELALVTFTVAAVTSGNAPLAYQWQRNGTNIFKGNQDAYTLPPVTAADDGSKYRCLVYLPGTCCVLASPKVIR